LIGRIARAVGGGAPVWPPRRTLGELALAIVVGLAGALAFVAIGLPLPWMLGALFSTTVASVARLPVAVPMAVRTPMSAVLGVLLGSSFDADVLAGMGLWIPSLAMLPAYIVIVSIVTIAYLRKVAGLDPKTAYFASTPGGLGEMILLGDRMGGDMRTISLVHATRVLVVVFAVPFAIGAIEGVTPSGLPPAATIERTALDLMVLVLCGVAGAWLGVLARLPAPMLLGPMIASAATHLLGVVDGAPPAWIVAGAQLLIGASVGVRFRGIDPVRALQAMAATLGLVAIMLVVTLLFAGALWAVTGLPLDQLVLAYVPGGLAEMAMIGYALGVDPTFVATHHIVRIGLVVLLAPLLYAAYRRVAGIPD
jgi:hypothetical protein